MSADPDRALLATSLAFAGAAVLGSAVAVREDLPGQPCGIGIPLPVPAGLLVGWGAGVAAPWPMPAAAVIVAVRSQRTQPHALTGAVCAGIGIGCILGTAIEPVTRRPRSWSPATRLAIASNIAASAALTVTGLRHRAAAKALRLRNQANQKHPDRTLSRPASPYACSRPPVCVFPRGVPRLLPGSTRMIRYGRALGCGPSAVVGAHDEHSVVAPGRSDTIAVGRLHAD